MGLISPGGENILDFVMLWQVPLELQRVVLGLFFPWALFFHVVSHVALVYCLTLFS